MKRCPRALPGHNGNLGLKISTFQAWCLPLLFALLCPCTQAAPSGNGGGEFSDFHASQFRRHFASAHRGVTASQYLLGTFYYHGNGVPRNQQEAAHWFHQAAQRKFPAAQNALGQMYFNGEGVQRHIPTAILWLRQAAQHGVSDAQYKLGWIFDLGRDVPHDFDEATAFYLKAARQDHTEAQYRLALLLANAPDKHEDPVSALKWATLAATRGQARAARLRDRLTAQLTADQKLRAEAMIRQHGNRRLFNPAQGGDFQQLFQQARDFLQTGDYDKALQLLKHCRTEAVRTLKPMSADMAGFLNDLAVAYSGMGRYQEAVQLLDQCLTIHRQRYNPKVPSTAVLLASALRQASRLRGAKLGDYANALRQANDSLALCEATFGATHLETALGHANLGVLHRAVGNSRQAEQFLSRALALREAAPADQSLAFIQHNLAGLLRETGNYDAAEPLYQRCLRLLEKTAGKDHPTTADTLYDLALLYVTIGDTKKARPMLERCQKIWTVREHPNEAIALTGLADIYRDMGDLVQASSLYARAYRILRRALGTDHPVTRLRVTRLAALFRASGHLAFAESLLNDNLNVLGRTHLLAGESFLQLAYIAMDRGDLPGADRHLQQALIVMQKHYGDHNSMTTEALAAMAKLQISRSKPVLARAYALKTAESREQLLAQVLSFASERQRLQFQSRQRHHDLLATLGDAPRLLTTVLRTKGVVLDSLVEDQLAAEASRDPAISRLLNELRGSSRQLVQLRLQMAQQTDKATRRKQDAALEKLQKHVENLQRSLAQNVAGIGRARRGLSVQSKDVQAQLPPASALVEFIEYRRYEPHRWRVVLDRTPRDPKTLRLANAADRLPYLGAAQLDFPGKSKDPLNWLTTEGFEPVKTPDLWERHYGALVLGPRNEPVWVPLGPARAIDRLLDNFDPARHRNDEIYARVLRALHAKLIAPLAKALPLGTSTLILAPDGRLNHLNFATLLQPAARGQDRFLCEKYLIKYVSTGRDLLAANPAAAKAARQLAVFANPAFDGQAAPAAPRRGAMITRSMDMQSLRTLKFQPLPGTAKEAQYLRTQSARWNLQLAAHLGAAATEQNLYALRSPHILHLATHGFFLPAPKATAATALRNPMHRSGLALAGASRTLAAWRAGRTPPTEKDGILTAAEVGTLQLRDTWLVVLSACQSGAGEVRSGEGVMGLRRGFVLAGTRHLLMTLWPVSDQKTYEFMKDFYSRTLATRDPSGALPVVQRNWLTRLRREEGLKVAVQIAGPFLLSLQGGEGR